MLALLYFCAINGEPQQMEQHMVDLSGDYFDTAIRYCKNCDEEYLMLEDAEECLICGKELPEEE